MDSRHKELSQVNLLFSKNESLNACVLLKNLLIESYEDLSFYCLVINNLIENFSFLVNNDRYLLTKLGLNKLNTDIKVENISILTNLLQSTNYETRLNTINFIDAFFTDEMIGLDIKYQLLAILEKDFSTVDERKAIFSMIELRYNIFGDYFIRNLKSTAYSRKNILLKNEISRIIDTNCNNIKMNIDKDS